MGTTRGRQWQVFSLYTIWSAVAVLVLVPVGLALLLDAPPAQLMDEGPAGFGVLVVLVPVAAFSAYRALSRWAATPPPPGRGLGDLPTVGSLPTDHTLAMVVLGVLALLTAQVKGPVTSEELLIGLSAAAASLLIRWRWEIGLAGTAALGAVATWLLGELRTGIAVGTLVLAVVMSIRVSLWLAAIVRELDRARDAQADLAVAEERLRFARDLHDVTGRDLSAIAVKAELVAQLAERGDARAAPQGKEVAQIARASLAEIRALVRGYRTADLPAELRGTASLLRSAHVEVEIHGGAEDIPSRFAERAAWVLREAGTNILRHAAPTTVTITLGADGLTLVNDGAGDGPVIEGSGLAGMRERLGDDAALTARRDAGTFTLDVRLDPPRSSR